MLIEKIELRNWRNFREAGAEGLPEICYVLGPNASGKSNFLDALRFLRDVAKPRGGGLQGAIDDRDGIKKLRCLHARNPTDVALSVVLAEQNSETRWHYNLSFNVTRSGLRTPQVVEESVRKITRNDVGASSVPVLKRPNADDRADSALLTSTHLEQIAANKEFRSVSEFFGGITYVHLVPQLLKFSGQIGGRVMEDDPFGQAFMERIAAATDATRKARLERIERALRQIVPHLEDLIFLRDEKSGRPRLQIRYKHHRPHGAKQMEDQFSDGTLRLISLLWLLQDTGESPMLLEEPELSLNEEIVRQIPELILAVRRATKRRLRQVFITTHSRALLSNPGIDPQSIFVIVPSEEGSSIRRTTEAEIAMMESGIPPSEAVLPSAQGSFDLLSTL